MFIVYWFINIICIAILFVQIVMFKPYQDKSLTDCFDYQLVGEEFEDVEVQYCTSEEYIRLIGR